MICCTLYLREGLKNQNDLKIRVVRLNSTFAMEHLAQREDQAYEHLSKGFLCFPNHGRENSFLANFTVTNITTNSTDVSWNFYKWDIRNPLLLWITIYVLTDEVVISRIKVDIMGDEKLYFSQHIAGLQSCTNYTIKVEGNYGTEEKIVRQSFQTHCRRRRSIFGWNISDLFLASMCTTVLVLVVILIAMLLKRRSRREILHEVYGFHNVVEF